ncbi:MAG: hypothetical protein ABI947_04595 [Chloroflexota bacterium]
MDLKTQIEQFFTDVKDIAKLLAPVAAFIGIVGAGIIYTGAGLPVIGTLKRNNPDLMNNILIGMGVLIAAGTISSLIVYT